MHRLRDIVDEVWFDFEGRPLRAQAGEPVAASLLAQGTQVFTRSLKYHRPRGPYCFTGACAQCLVRIDGVPNVPACQTPVAAGMRVERQNGFPDVDVDVFAANDLVFRTWFDHHSFLAGVPVAQSVMLQVARSLAGLGTLPDAPGAERPAAVLEQLPVVIVGAGASGSAAAVALSATGVSVTLVERERSPGGRHRWDPRALQPGPAVPPSVDLRLGATAIGLYADEGRPVLATVWNGRLHLLQPEQLLLAPGGHPAMVPFDDNDRPGIFGWRAMLQLARAHGVLVGRRIACVGTPALAVEVARALQALGAQPVAVGATPVRTHGRARVTGMTVRSAEGATTRVACDAVAVCVEDSPSFELAAALGVEIQWRPERGGFIAACGPDGQTTHAQTFVAGRLAGAVTAAEAAESGRRAAEAMRRART